MKLIEDDAAEAERRCSLCGGPEHKTKAAVLACSQTRRKEFAELHALVWRRPKADE